ncbi:MAG: Transcriptional regulatory protein QseF [Syntrophorhabdaceae bacterium PtaU1.Bin034]|jgi:two-component system response regulator GlrR|nr:MAG: Transcriptional regulatory protein QseF [Syntrophorhabdaceae bacterium PtaU1.Bin034]
MTALSSKKILVVDDDGNFLKLIRMRLELAGYEVTTALNEDEAIARAREETFDLSILDLKLVHKDGISLMEEMHSINPYVPIIILTAHGSIESAVEATKKGAFNFLNKPFDPEELLLQIEKAMENQRLVSEVRRLEGLLREKYDFQNIIARSEKMQKVLELVSRIAGTDSTIYLSGESGTGKEVIAKAIHLASGRREKPFVAINCAAIPETLLESELFGYEKGAFTSATRTHRGLFVQAHQGTIFLDEIGDMPLSIQAKLLRVLQEKTFYPLGSGKPVEVDARVIVATNKDLEAEVKNGSFREDLFYRIHVVPVDLPPLRERKEDIPLLAEHFMREISQRMKKEIKGISPMAMQKLMLYDWPGNVRELENTIERAVAITQHDVISEEIVLPTKDLPAESLKPFKEAVEEFKRGYVVRLLEFTKGNVSKAADLAGKYRADFYNLVKKHNLKPEDFKNLDKEK